MYTCRHVQERASALIDGELPFLQDLGVRLHLMMCSSCSRFMGQLRLLVGRVGARGASAKIPADRVEQILDKLPLDKLP